ncbi:MAG: collagen-like protein [Syntrophaceae bacterium]|nr:collagen-like protein [Syntrophaceae bacterium]
MVTRKSICGVWGFVILLGAIVIFGGMKEVSAQVNINFNLGSTPPQEVVAAPNDVYFVPDQSAADVFYNNGYWWATRDNQWYRSNDYNGTWKTVEQRYVPAPVYQVYKVPNYREFYGKQQGNRYPYGLWKKQGYLPYGQWKKQGNQGVVVQEKPGNVGKQGDQGKPGEQGHQGKPGEQGHQGDKGKQKGGHGK